MGENMTTRKFRSLSDTLCVLVNKGPTLGIEDPVPALGVILDALSDEYKAMTADWTTDMIADDQRIAMGATVKRNVDGHKVYVRWSVEDKAYIATVLDLPGCKADGGNLAEVLDEVRKAIRLHVQTQAEIDRENASQNDQQGVAYKVDGFQVFVRWSNEDQTFIAHVPSILSGPDADEDPDLNKALEKARDLIRKYRAEQAQNAPQT